MKGMLDYILLCNLESPVATLSNPIQTDNFSLQMAALSGAYRSKLFCCYRRIFARKINQISGFLTTRGRFSVGANLGLSL